MLVHQFERFLFFISKDCTNGRLIGNGICNDETNNAECNFDGGDCCGECINTDHCVECVCHAGSAPTLDLSCKRNQIML